MRFRKTAGFRNPCKPGGLHTGSCNSAQPAAVPTASAMLNEPPASGCCCRHRPVVGRRTAEHLGTVEANSQREAYAAAIEKFTVPIERQNRLFVAKIKND